MRKPYLQSLKSLLLAYETALLVLVIATAACAGLWAYFWQQSSRESVRINSLAYATQQIRGDLYTQIKHVSRARLLEDETALLDYQAHTTLINEHFDTLRRYSNTEDADETVGFNYIRQTYQTVQQDMQKISTDPYLINNLEGMKILDPLYEEWMLAEFESAVDIYNRILQNKREALDNYLNFWANIAPWIIIMAIMCGAVLFYLSRRSLIYGFLQPVSNLIQGSQNFSQGKLDYRIPELGVSEIRQLAQSFNLMAADLADSRDALVSSERQAALGALVPVVAHNIRNPLASIRAASQMLDDPDDYDDLHETKCAIIETVDRLERWVSSLLSYLHPLKPQLREVTLAVIVDGALAPLQRKLDAKQIQLIKHPWHPGCKINADIDLLEQAIYGLLNNAVDASSQAATILLQIEPESDDLTDKCCFTILDQGAGLPFEPKPGGLEPGPSTKRFGTGLGIPFAFKVCQAHRSELRFSNHNHGGTRVSIIFPGANTSA